MNRRLDGADGDAAAGAAMGSASGWFFTDAFNNKVQLVPWADSNGAGIEATVAWE